MRKSQYSSMNYAINSTFWKIFNTRSQEVVDVCLEMFNCLPAEKAIALRKRKFLKKIVGAMSNIRYVCQERTDAYCSVKLFS